MAKSDWKSPRKLRDSVGFYLGEQVLAQRPTMWRVYRHMIQRGVSPLRAMIALPFLAWTTPTTRSTGDLITASIWNADVVDNLEYLHDTHACLVFNNANISIPSGVETTVTFNSEVFDTDSFHSTASNTERLSAPLSGTYAVGGSFHMAGAAAGNLRLNIFYESGSSDAILMFQPFQNAVAHRWTCSTIFDLTASDYFWTTMQQNTGGALNLNYVAQYSPYAWMLWLGD